jgi:cysteine-rich repeat protein
MRTFGKSCLRFLVSVLLTWPAMVAVPGCSLPVPDGADAGKRDSATGRDCSMPAPQASCGWYYCSDGTWQYAYPILCGWNPDATPLGHRCGDGLRSSDEECDDGNTQPGDGCGALCQIEANWSCPQEGMPCIRMSLCGDGMVTSDETCDDGNATDGDGCAADCQSVDVGWWCPWRGRPCVQGCSPDGGPCGVLGCSSLDGDLCLDRRDLPAGVELE